MTTTHARNTTLSPLHSDAQGEQRNLCYRKWSLTPAFLDTRTGTIYPSTCPNGSPAPLHLLSSLPATLIQRDPNGKPIAPAQGVIVGYVRNGEFLTRDEAAQLADTLPTE